MNHKTHLVGGVLIGLATISPISEVVQINMGLTTAIGATYMMSSVVGSLFPDLDHRGTYLSKRMKLTSLIISNMFSHRGATHSPLLIFLGTSILYFLSKLFYLGNISLIIAIGFFMGAISHVFLDWFTVRGVPLFMPFSKKKFSIFKMSSGKIGEKFVFLICTIMIFVLLIYKIDISIFSK